MERFESVLVKLESRRNLPLGRGTRTELQDFIIGESALEIHKVGSHSNGGCQLRIATANMVEST